MCTIFAQACVQGEGEKRKHGKWDNNEKGKEGKQQISAELSR